jgi:hypothetical protein
MKGWVRVPGVAMDEFKSEKGKLSNLRSAMRRARAESAEQHEALADLRQAETARLELLEDAIRPILDQTPDEVEMFDLGVTHGDRPRLFLDMISFVDLAHDRRTFRFFQDTRHGRVLIAESDSPDKIVAAVTNYVARRLVEREQALAADWRSRGVASEHIRTRAKADSLARQVKGKTEPERRRRSFWRMAGDAFGFLLLTLGAITLCVGLFLVLQAAWEVWGRAYWEAHLGHAPF